VTQTVNDLQVERDGDVLVLRIDNPARMNPLSVGLQEGLRAELARVRGDAGVRAVLLTGSGKAFCVGADLAGMGPQPGDTRSLGNWTADKMQELSNPLVAELRELPVPVVVALNGAAAGAGVGLALAGDIVVAARSSYFYLPFLPKLGIVPDLGTTWFLTRLLGRSRAAGLALLGERLGAEDAQRWGLVWACVDDAELHAQALAIASRLAALPAHAVSEARRAFDAAQDHTLAEQLQYEADRQRALIDRPEFAEGVAAFLQKREPAFPPRGA
jgi:2-(1,2-epoxy-1,2-dihydrophenyl)acetyl-CoA isomerase